MSFYKYLFTPKLFKEYSDMTSIASIYQMEGLEKFGSSLISFCGLFFSLAKYGSPMLTLYFYKKGYLAVDNLGHLIKISTGIGLIVVISYCIRGFGRSQSESYKRFVKVLEDAKANYNDTENKKKLRLYDFEFEQWPVDWSMNTENTKGNKSKKLVVTSSRGNVKWVSPCSIAAFVAIHTFGLKMIYPGSIKLIQKYLHPMLVQGRAKMIIENRAIRNKIETVDNNQIDTIFIDNRASKSENGKTLVITAEGNAGFYEVGIMTTPIELSYSVLGFNHPGFAGSSGEPFTDQDQNAIDAVMQFALRVLKFLPENIILFGWSIGGYSTLWLSTQYPNVKGIILDATFDDLLYLALPRMPESLSAIVKIAIREHCNLNNTDLITKYNGPVALIRRTDDEVICTEENNIGTNRANYLLIHMLKYRFPNIFQTEQLTFAQEILNGTIDHGHLSDDQMCLSLILSYVSENGSSYPIHIGDDYTKKQRDQMFENVKNASMVARKNCNKKAALVKAKNRRYVSKLKPQQELQDDTKDACLPDSTTDLLYLRIVTSKFGLLLVQVSYFDSGLQIKEKAIKKLEASHSPSSLFTDKTNCFKLVRLSTKNTFRDYDSILGTNVRNMEEFLMLTKRPKSAIDNLMKVHNTCGPTEKEILMKTKHLPIIRSSISSTLSPSMDATFFQGDLQHDLRKILSEIAKYSAYILGSLPFAEKLIKYYRQKILMSLYNHQDIVKLLMDMGFSQENVIRALKLQGNNYTMALDWLVENVSKASVEEHSSLELSSESIDDLTESTYKKLCKTTFPSTNSIFYPKHKAINIKEKVEGLLEIVRYYSEKNNDSNGLQDTVNSLINMGFPIDEIQQALRATSNNQTAACEWLLEHSVTNQNSTALRESIFVESHILKILLNTPQIQMSLSSPKFFIAYCSMLENYSSLNIFFNDIESQSLLQHILRTYHEERIYFHTFSNSSSSSS
ncbi:CLUMA_CG012594, isoform A [Clunio marinus]|uniref:CLUMA_CG012594, isoform A n=1 Tax=Clunio marinus TaxID=568069 RepID=A0A1J1IGL4_9DIPT|nr:CLUMA_CG012594, isoform A [Clunio marinus]